MRTLLHRRRTDEVPDLRAYHADLAPRPVTTAAPAPRILRHQPDVSKPATSAVVLEQLHVDDRAEAAAHARSMVLGPLLTLLAEPEPRTDWLYALGAVEAKEVDCWLAMRQRTTRDLDGWYNASLCAWWSSTAEVIFPARELAEQLVADVATSILDEVTV